MEIGKPMTIEEAEEIAGDLTQDELKVELYELESMALQTMDEYELQLACELLIK